MRSNVNLIQKSTYSKHVRKFKLQRTVHTKPFVVNFMIERVLNKIKAVLTIKYKGFPV